MAYRLAIAISGAVSLGSYEAGVVFEIVRAIGQHNLQNNNQPEKQIHIDVLTGASAGGMTAAIIAQKLMFEKSALEGAETNDMHRAWVEQVDIKSLLSNDYGDDPNRSLLSSNFVGKIAEDILLTRYKTSEKTIEPHPASAKTVHLGLALSNLNGVDYAVDAFKNSALSSETGEFVQTRFQDSLTRVIGEQQDNLETWQEITVAARASGAFPGAFAPQSFERNYNEVDYFGKSKKFNQETFTYVDGGTFNNYPLGMAKSLVNNIDTDPLDCERRFYLYISPNSKVSTKNPFDGAKANIFEIFGAINTAVFNQARFQDWILTSHFNTLVDEMDRRAEDLSEHLLTASDEDINAMSRSCDILVHKIFDTEEERDCNAELKILAARYENTGYAQTLKNKKGDFAFNAWLKAIQILEAGGRLHNKDHMPIYTITANNTELASDGLFAFTGFLEQRLREHDYTVGRKKAREFLQQLRNVVLDTSVHENHLPLTDFTLDDPLPEIENLGGIKIGQTSKSARKELKRRFHSRMDLWLKNMGMNKIVRFFVLLFVDSKVAKLLELK